MLLSSQQNTPKGFRAAWELHFSGSMPISPVQSEPVQPGQVHSRGSSTAPTPQRDTRQAGETSCPVLLYSTSYGFTVQRQPLHFICVIQGDPHSPASSCPFPSRIISIQQDNKCHSRQHHRCIAYNLGTNPQMLKTLFS